MSSSVPFLGVFVNYQAKSGGRQEEEEDEEVKAEKPACISDQPSS